MGAEDSKPKFLLTDPDTIVTVVSTKYLVDGYIVLGESTFIFGPPKQLKTFLVLSWLLCIATGLDWFGYKVRRAKVVYFIGEGIDAFMGRIKAWQITNSVPNLNQNFMVVRKCPNLYDGSLKSTIDEIKAQGFTPDVVAIDTFGRAMGAAKEVTEDFNKIFINIDAMMQEHLPGVSLVVVGHTRKADLIFKGPQVLAGNIDNMIYVERIGKELKANAYSEFSRNASEFHDIGFTLIPLAVATDEGMQNFLAVNGLTAASDNKAAGTTDKEKDDELAFKTLLSFYQGDHTWTQHTVWFRVTKAARGDKLGNSTFSDIIKSLLAKGRIRVNAEGLYQVVFGPAEPPSSSAGDAYSSSSYSPPKEAGVGGVTVDCSRNTPGVGSSNKVGVEADTRQSRKGENAVVSEPAKGGEDVAAEALKHLTEKTG